MPMFHGPQVTSSIVYSIEYTCSSRGCAASGGQQGKNTAYLHDFIKQGRFDFQIFKAANVSRRLDRLL